MAIKFVIEPERCKSCSYCVISCPKKLFSLGEAVNSHGYHVAKIDKPEDCVLCMSCSIMCPEAAIEIYKEG